MNFLELAKKRYSVRKFKDKPVEKSILDQVLEAGHVAPTAANRQPHRLIVVQEKAGIEKIRKTANIYGAPVAIIVCVNPSEAWVRPFDRKNLADVDASIVTDHMMLQATDLNLGSLWVCYFDPKIIKEEFNIPDGLEALNILAIGYSDAKQHASDRHSKTRKPLGDTVYYETM